MKRFFKAPESKQNSKRPVSAAPIPPLPPPIISNTGLQPKDTVPLIPYQNPHEHLAILVTKKGLLLRPHASALTRTESHVKISWGLGGTVEELQGDGVLGADSEADWAKAVIIYGIIGILDLFSGACLRTAFVPPQTHQTVLSSILSAGYIVQGGSWKL
jgi:phosphatidylinositol 4-phosphatase